MYHCFEIYQCNFVLTNKWKSYLNSIELNLENIFKLERTNFLPRKFQNVSEQRL